MKNSIDKCRVVINFPMVAVGFLGAFDGGSREELKQNW
jgi:hypothetical protein